MSFLLHSLLFDQAVLHPDRTALVYKQEELSYRDFAAHARKFAAGYSHMQLPKGSRVGVYLTKQTETVCSFLGTLYAGGCMVPINPVLKADQVHHIMCDCDVSILITSLARLNQLADIIEKCPQLTKIVLVDFNQEKIKHYSFGEIIASWDEFCSQESFAHSPNIIESDLAAIFYTSGSTGKPKGVVLTHHNMRVGAESVAQYQCNTEHDRILAALPFSFDYGFSQLTTALVAGAAVVLLDYLLPKDVIKALDKYRITGLAGVPPLWMQITKLTWPSSVQENLRYITNSGGAMPQTTLSKLQERLPKTDIYLMYGLTEAFRSTYLPPDQVNIRPTSMGKAIPNAEIFVINSEGKQCEPDEVGELVHRGPLVGQGYWNDPKKTAERYKPLPASLCDGRTVTELAVWSGDSVKKDAEGFLYFVSRTDEMIKTSGYRVSPTEVEEAMLKLDYISEAVAMGVPHAELGQAIIVAATSNADAAHSADNASTDLKKYLPPYMLPQKIVILDQLPRNANGKFDRKQLYLDFENSFAGINE